MDLPFISPNCLLLKNISEEKIHYGISNNWFHDFTDNAY